MSVAKQSKCVFCALGRSARSTVQSRRPFSSSPRPLARKPKFPSIKLSKTKLNKIPSIHQDYLEKAWTPEQRAAIQAADKVVNNEKISQVDMTSDPWAMKYFDDLTKVDPVVDHPVRAPWGNFDGNSRLKTDDELNDDLLKFMREMPDDENKAVEAWRKFDENLRLTVGKEEAERNPRSAQAPELPKMGSKVVKKPGGNSDGPAKFQAEPSPALLQLMQATGMTKSQILNLRVKSIVRHRVVNQTRLGKIQKQYVLSVAGNGNGLIGVGEGKSEDPIEALQQSQYRAIRSMQPILRYENRTIFGDVNGKVSATELELYARPPGFGLRCQQYIYEICRAAGISDLAARVTRSRNPMNTVKAAVQALMSQKDPEEIAKARGKKLVDVRKVYYANQV